ncbi:MAG: addiction module protein [Candidatus Tectomicrobia bacterium]|uniref:Addiction module protein n=1 Tax=Tectimicrobiota bacterium TaxID=2528274 RepID=A0A937W261_UNCTE|nr:addiction module protein [Candidatus Tectomicrobia bacterium]
MALSTTLAEIVSLSIDQRIRLVEAIWDSIATEPGQPELTVAQQQELERRLAAHTASPKDVVSWKEVKAQALARARQ